MILTKENYFSDNNNYLSNSKINDWLKGKDYFYRKDITHEIKNKKTKSMLIGSAVDNILTDINNLINGNYAVRQFNGTTKDGKAETRELLEAGKTIITKDEYDEILAISDYLSQTTAYKELHDHKSQEILQVDMPLGEHFVGLCGVPDWYKIEAGICMITDLKTTNSLTRKDYYYHAKEMGYFRQQAFYRMLLGMLNPEIIDYINRIIVIDTEKDVYNMETYIVSEREINIATTQLQKIISEIIEEKEFKRKDITWENAKILQDPKLNV